MRIHRLLVAAFIVTTGCYGATTSGSETLEGGSASSSKESAPKSGAVNTPKTPAVAQSETTTCDQDASICDRTETAAKKRVTLDGKSCTASTQYPGGLDMGLGGNGWTYNYSSDDCGIILEISGVDDAAYPQTDGVTFLHTPAIELFTNEDVGADSGVGGTFLTTPDSAVVIESGPVSHVAKTITGHATVPGSDNSGSHVVTFELDF